MKVQLQIGIADKEVEKILEQVTSAVRHYGLLHETGLPSTMIAKAM